MNIKREFDFLELGGTIYTPSISKHILVIANGQKFDKLKSVVFCLEDKKEFKNLSPN